MREKQIQGEDMDYSIKGKLSYKDYKNFLWAANFHKKWRVIFYVLLAGIFIYLMVKSFISAPTVYFGFRRIVPYIVILLVYGLLMILMTRRSFFSDAALQKEMTFTFTEEGFVWSTDRGSYTYKVEDFKDFVFGKKVIGIYISNRKAIVIPRHFFESKEQEEAVEKMMKENYVVSKRK